MRIVLDAMGSDEAPEPELEGAALATSLDPAMEVILVGDKAALEAGLTRYPKHGKISILHATEAVTMDDSPMVAVRKKKDSSLLVGLRLVKEGKADAFLSAGNTGAVMLGSRVVLGPIPGVARSAICQVLPTRTGGNVVVLDLGANAECTAEHLCQFAEMGTVFSRLTLGVDSPRVGLINIGEEVSKGTDTAKRVHRALSSVDGINFIGNVEPKALFNGETDVAVCDGFVGNIILKTLESSAALVKTMVENELRSSWISMVGAAISWGAFKRLRAKTDPNSRGGAPLLGVNGIVIIAHGSSTADGIKNALLNAREEYELGLNKHIQTGIAEFRVDIAPLRPEAAQS